MQFQVLKNIKNWLIEAQMKCLEQFRANSTFSNRQDNDNLSLEFHKKNTLFSHKKMDDYIIHSKFRYIKCFEYTICSSTACAMGWVIKFPWLKIENIFSCKCSFCKRRFF